ncbi:MAG: Fe2+-dependent dioxygenase [Leptolyngbya sp.]|nr:Fe2+-dependent dioxygenase [Leptolyngbya sp.]
MIVCIDSLLSSADLATIHDLLQTAEFVDGKLTAGTFAKTVKHNDQIKGDSDIAQAIRNLIQPALLKNPLFQAIARPKAIRPLLISRYTPGMAYGWHTDNAVMGDSPPHRSDISLTVFLSDPAAYDGGELMLDTGLGHQTIKLAAGSAIVYPSTYLHQVTEVTQGVRFAAVTWVQSQVRSAHHREILFDLDTVRRSLFEKDGKTTEFDLLSKTHANLLRQWVEV